MHGCQTNLLKITLIALCLGPWARAQDRDNGDSQKPRIPQSKIPPAPPLAPEEARQRFQVPPGFRVELVASEPMVEEPIVLLFDPDGRLWVVEMRGFMPDAAGLGETQPVGRVSILEDTDGDGRMDRKRIFLDGLVLPRALLLVKGGVLVCEPPRLWFYSSTNDQAGDRVLVAADFAKEADPSLGARMNLEHSGNSLAWNLDNWIYCLHHPYRYRLRAGKWEREPTPLRVQWGLAQDDYGRLFYTSDNDQLRGDLVPSHYFARLPARQKLPGISVQIVQDQTVWPARANPGVNRADSPDTLRGDGTLAKFTAACGTCVYRAALFPKEFYGNAFVCEPAANLVRRIVLSEQDGIVTGHNPYRQTEFLTSTDELFRPVNLAAGPDGGLYIADMYHGIIQHRLFATPYLRAQVKERGLDKVIDKGRIWRVVREDTPPRPPASKPHLSKESSANLVKLLSHPNGWWRDTAQRLLVERDDLAIVPALQALATNAPNPVTRLHALWSLEGSRRLSAPTIAIALDDPDAKVRAAAIRLAEAPLQNGSQDSAALALREKILALARDASAAVQIQLALSLGVLPQDEKTRQILSNLSSNSTVMLAREAASIASATHEPAKSELVIADQGRPLTEEEKRRFEAGRAMFEATCLACHQQHGLGQAGLAPPLVGSEWVAGSDQRLIRIVLNGLRGPMQVKGDKFELDMPALGVLDDEQIAAVLTYVRREWGHRFEPVTPEAVKKARAETASREDAWTMVDLLKVP